MDKAETETVLQIQDLATALRERDERIAQLEVALTRCEVERDAHYGQDHKTHDEIERLRAALDVAGCPHTALEADDE